MLALTRELSRVWMETEGWKDGRESWRGERERGRAEDGDMYSIGCV